MKGKTQVSANENQIVVYQPNETVWLDVLNDHEYGGRLSAIGRSNDEIGPKVFREYFRVKPGGMGKSR